LVGFSNGLSDFDLLLFHPEVSLITSRKNLAFHIFP
jgi:hypothetical protein